ncbi:hypothetical protein LCM10_15145 [Rossellomorea aquimaris]|uniref:hypothetical protein n=1 Tax=Rossellomorea aquimaris TaxID=189382 RepID=UPI001CD7894A|nr:hypothetical protein [Rossellomorea aquimaris]MCA1056335.1 hypothetical protein [Rossellomorea aquimaris]
MKNLLLVEVLLVVWDWGCGECMVWVRSSQGMGFGMVLGSVVLPGGVGAAGSPMMSGGRRSAVMSPVSHLSAIFKIYLPFFHFIFHFIFLSAKIQIYLPKCHVYLPFTKKPPLHFKTSTPAVNPLSAPAESKPTRHNKKKPAPN